MSDNKWREAFVNELAAEFFCEGGGPYSIGLDGCIQPLTKEETDQLIADAYALNEHGRGTRK